MASKLEEQICGSWAQNTARRLCEWREAWIFILVGGQPQPVSSPGASGLGAHYNSRFSGSCILCPFLHAGLPSSHMMACLGAVGGRPWSLSTPLSFLWRSLPWPCYTGLSCLSYDLRESTHNHVDCCLSSIQENVCRDFKKPETLQPPV